MKFNSTYNRTYKDEPEKNVAGRLIEKAGYIPAQTRIENMILAGQRLADYRKEQFDFAEEKDIDEDFYDPTRKKSLDMGEAFQIAENLNKSIRARQHLVKASQTAQEAPEKAPEQKNDPE